jgi:DNA-binding GntR family transcriptional regulator
MVARRPKPRPAPAAVFQVQSVADQVYAVLRDRIAAGQIARGDRIHQEDLASELGISRTPVREALRRLAAEGLVDLKANRGARVSSSDAEDVRLSYETRLVVEPGAARFAAARRPPGPLREMRAAIAREVKAGSSAARLFEANRDFHLALVAAAGNEWLTRFMEQIWIGRIGAQLYEEHPDSTILQNDHRAHASIADAVEAGDGDLAEELTRGHILRSLELVGGR